MPTNTAISRKLNGYTGDNIWQDVILNLPGYDEEATEEIDPGGASDRFVANGVTYRCERGTWGEA